MTALNTRTQILLILQAYAEVGEPPPTLKELAARLGMTCSTVHRQLSVLRRAGYVDFQRYKSRTLHLTRKIVKVY